MESNLLKRLDWRFRCWWNGRHHCVISATSRRFTSVKHQPTDKSLGSLRLRRIHFRRTKQHKASLFVLVTDDTYRACAIVKFAIIRSSSPSSHTLSKHSNILLGYVDALACSITVYPVYEMCFNLASEKPLRQSLKMTRLKM